MGATFVLQSFPEAAQEKEWQRSNGRANEQEVKWVKGPGRCDMNPILPKPRNDFWGKARWGKEREEVTQQIDNFII